MRPGEARQTLRCLRHIRAQHPRRSERRQPIFDIEAPRHAHLDVRQSVPLRAEVECIIAVIIFRQRGGMHVAIRRQPEGNRPAVEARQLANHTLIRPLADGDAVFRQQVQKLPERLFNLVDILVAVQVVRVDIQHNRHCRMHMQERAVEFTRFSGKNIAVTDAG